MCTKESRAPLLIMIVLMEQEFQGWEVRYEVGRSVTASRASGRKGLNGDCRGGMDIFQDGEQTSTAWTSTRRQGSSRYHNREMRISAAGAQIQCPRENVGQALETDPR